jgi:hypothetical protein
MRKKSGKKKWMFFVCIGIIGVGAVLYTQLVAPAPTVGAGAQKVIYPVQYSDTHITENAIATDERFKDLAVFNKRNFLAGVVGAFLETAPAPAPGGPEKGTWLWTPTLDLTPSYRDSIIAGAKNDGITTIYLSLDSYLDIYVMPEGPKKEKQKKAFDDILENFIIAAHKANMTVDAEAGWRNWAEPGNEYKAFAMVDYVQKFNAAHTEKLRGLQYDIEPYLLSEYATDKEAVLRNFIDLVNETASRLAESDLAFSVVIPDFYDGTGGETPRFFYGWKYGTTLTHLLGVLDRRPGSALLVMAYRNRSEGADGSIAISQDEIRVANSYHSKVIIAQETGDVLPPSLTFYNSSLSNLNTQIKNIQNAFTGDKSYNGIAIHYLNALMALE